MSHDKNTKYKDLMKEKKYLLVLGINTLATFGFMLFLIGFIWLAYEMSATPFMAGVIILGASSPYLVFGLVGGAYSDRWNRKKIIIYSNLVTSFLSLIVPFLAWINNLSIWYLALTAFGIVSLRCFFSPTIRALVPSVLPKEYWPKGNSVFQVASQLTKAIAPALGGVLIASVSPMSVYVLFCLLLLVSVAIIFPLKMETKRKNSTETSVFRDIRETFVFLYHIKPLFWSIVLFGFVLLLITGIERIALPDVSDNIWNRGAQGFGLIVAFIGVGNIIGALVLGKFSITSYTRLIFTGWAVWGASMALIGLMDVFYAALFFAILAGIAESLNDLPMVLMIQQMTPEHHLGKVFSAWSTVAFVGESGSSILVGVMISFIGLTSSFILTAVVIISISIVGFMLIRKVKKEEVIKTASG
ncbi:MFS transporter [Evansella tamaricis]|uniref:MFS transporter n=1 Tax=Evansella tamaricis TaxID=2069301 RepID=A0ABS6JE33_9BACI|nr:MFS transporter [Evansella tamaricis]MBU9711929.1 MFS transporter [Evansella tamaricis]